MSSGAPQHQQQTWQDMSVDDYTLSTSFQSAQDKDKDREEEGEETEEDDEGDISDDGTVNTVDLLSSVRNLVKQAEAQTAGDVSSGGVPNTAPAPSSSSSSYQEVSIRSDLSDDTSFLSHDERRDSFDDNTVSTMGSLREFFFGDDDGNGNGDGDDNGTTDSSLLNTSTTSGGDEGAVSSRRGVRGRSSPARSKNNNNTPDSLHDLASLPSAPTASTSTLGGAFLSPPLHEQEEAGAGAKGGVTTSLTAQGLKSCLSSRKKPRPARLSVSASAKKRGVVFGSPQAAEFHKTSPVTSFTPMREQDAKSLFSMAGKSAQDDEVDNDEQTVENSRILDEWDRLTNTSMDGSGSDEDSSSPEGSSTSSLASSGSKVMRRGNGRRATIGGASSSSAAASAASLSSPSKNKKRRQSVQAALPILHNSASLKRNKRRKSRLHISDSDIQPPLEETSFSNCIDASGLDTSGEASRTETLPGNLEELMQQPGLLPSSPSASSSCSSVQSSVSNPPTALNNLVRSAALNASMSMASLNDSMTDRTQTLESDLNALMNRVDTSAANGVASYCQQQQVEEDDEMSEDEYSRRLSGSSSGLSSVKGGLGALLDPQEEEEGDNDVYDTPARLRQIAASSSPTSSSDNSSMLSTEEVGAEVTVDSVISFKKREKRSSDLPLAS